jgi:hypothetical protein
MWSSACGQPDVPLPVLRQEPIIQTITGQPTQYVPAAQLLPGAFGQTTLNHQRHPEMVEIHNDLLPAHRHMVRAHELGHVIDDAVRTIPTTGLEHELVPMYNTLNNPKRTPSGLYADQGNRW